MDDETRDRIWCEVGARLDEGIGSGSLRDGIRNAILAALDACGEREPDPPPDSGGEVELPWYSAPHPYDDQVCIRDRHGAEVAVSIDDEVVLVRHSEIPHMARALFQAAGLEWPGDEGVERLKREVNQLQVQLAGCAVAAEGGTSPEHVAECGDYGWSASYQAVLDCRRELDQLRDTLREVAEAVGCEPSEVPERVRKVQTMRNQIVRAYNEMKESLKDEIWGRREAECERDKARAEVHRLRSELRQARKLAPETVALLRAASRYAEGASLLYPAEQYTLAGCPDLPEGGE